MNMWTAHADPCLSHLWHRVEASDVLNDPKCNTGPKCNKFLPHWENVIEVLSVIINLCFNSLLTWMKLNFDKALNLFVYCCPLNYLLFLLAKNLFLLSINYKSLPCTYIIVEPWNIIDMWLPRSQFYFKTVHLG